MKYDTPFRNNLGVSVSYGLVLDKQADFWGLSTSYVRLINEKWSIAVSLAYDQENDQTQSGADPNGKITNSFTFIGSITYSLAPNFSLTTGLSKGFLDDSNTSKNLSLTDGDWGTGIAAGYILPIFNNWKRAAFNLSPALEYNISSNEWTVSLDLGYGISF